MYKRTKKSLSSVCINIIQKKIILIRGHLFMAELLTFNFL